MGLTSQTGVTQVNTGPTTNPVSVAQGGTGTKLGIKHSLVVSPQRTSIRQLMASPPTVSWSTTNTITGRLWAAAAPTLDAIGGAVPAYGSYFSFTRTSSFSSDTPFPKYTFITGRSVNYGGGTLSCNAMGISFIHTGIALSIYIGGYGQSVMFKVDDQYVSFTPKTFPNDGSLNYGAVTFASSARRRIEIILQGGSTPAFGGVYTAATDTIQPAAIRGPRIIFIGDSFTEGSDASAGGASNYPIVFGEIMGWDDVWPSGVGGTGYLNAGGKLTYRSRLATDVIPYNPDIVCFTGGFNDSGSTAAAIAAENLLCLQYIKSNLPNCLIACAAPFLASGISYAGAFNGQVRPLFQANVLSVGGIFLDVLQMPLPVNATPQATTLAASSSANATTLSTNAPLVPFATYQFADLSSCVCTASSGGGPYSATVDKSVNAQSNGATITQVGSCLWVGNGNVGAPSGVGNCDVLVDTGGIHPTQAGHEAIAEALAYAFMNQLSSN